MQMKRTVDDLVPPESKGEAELLALLQLLSTSTPLSKVVCFEGFAYDGPGDYNATIFGCGTPNIYEIVIFRLNVPAFATWHQDKAWLTADVLNLLGWRFLVRENVKSLFQVSSSMAVTHWTFINFSVSGMLYNFMVILDPDLDNQLFTPSSVMEVLYLPLVSIIGKSLLGLFLYVILKAGLLVLLDRYVTGWSKVQGKKSNQEKQLANSTKRLPIEKLLEIPIRARSLVRTTRALEQIEAHDYFITPAHTFDTEIIVRNGQMDTRIGFFNLYPHEIDLNPVKHEKNLSVVQPSS